MSTLSTIVITIYFVVFLAMVIFYFLDDEKQTFRHSMFDLFLMIIWPVSLLMLLISVLTKKNQPND